MEFNKIFQKYINSENEITKIKYLCLFFFILYIKICCQRIHLANQKIIQNYIQVQNELNISFSKRKKGKINIGIYAYGLKNGGRARSTSLLINYFKNIKIFDLYLFSRRLKEDDEYKIPDNIKRTLVNQDLIIKIKKKKIHILIYQLSSHTEIKCLNSLKYIKVIFYQHLGVFDWIYGNYTNFKLIYREYLNSKYVVNIIPFENDYLFKKWGIHSIFMNNFMTYNYSNILNSDLSTDRILLIGRGDAKKKRFEIGIKAMEYINQEIPQSEMLIISDLTGLLRHKILIDNLNLFNVIKFIGYTVSPEIFYKNTSINLFPSISEAFPLVMCETKIYGIPNILIGLDYTSISEGGTIIIYDENPESFAKTAIDVLKNKDYRNRLGNIARKSMKHFNNDKLLMKWIKLITSIYNGVHFYNIIREKDTIISQKIILDVINNQINLLKQRIPIFNNISINNFENFSFMENII